MADTERPRYSFRDLSAMDRLDADALRSLFKAEMAGEDFYNALADRVADPGAAELLRRNGKEEAGHARRLGRAIALLEGSDFVPTPDLLDRRPVVLPDELDPAVLANLVQGELDGDAGYQRWADNEPNPDVQRLLRLNGREESIHGGRVQQVLALLGVATPA